MLSPRAMHSFSALARPKTRERQRQRQRERASIPDAPRAPSWASLGLQWLSCCRVALLSPESATAEAQNWRPISAANPRAGSRPLAPSALYALPAASSATRTRVRFHPTRALSRCAGGCWSPNSTNLTLSHIAESSRAASPQCGGGFRVQSAPTLAPTLLLLLRLSSHTLASSMLASQPPSIPQPACRSRHLGQPLLPLRATTTSTSRMCCALTLPT